MKLSSLIVLSVLVQGMLHTQDRPLAIRIDTSMSIVKATVGEFEAVYAQAGTFLPGDSISKAWYHSFRPAFERQIDSAKFAWPDTTFIWVDLCCSSTGKIEHVLYVSRDLDHGAQGKKFQTELESFARGYIFPLTANKKYSQCGTFRFPEKQHK